MKKIYIAMAVLATAALSSCVQEQSFEGHVLGKGEVSFVLRAGASTRSSEGESPVRKGVNVLVGEIGNQPAYLEETITDLASIAPRTKGVPVFTENVGTLYKDQLSVHTDYTNFEDTTFDTEGDDLPDGGWRYFHRYENAPWPENGDPVGFYMYMPADAEEVDIPSTGYSEGKITFGYTSPEAAEDQNDIIFSYVSITEEQHKAKFSEGGYPVTFYHALTAVKFALANSSDEITAKGIQVDSILFINLHNDGTCTVNPGAADTAADPIVSWDAEAVDDLEGKHNKIYQTFAEGELVEFSATSNPDFGSSFFAGNDSDKQNVNKQDASKTFWLIPQAFSAANNPTLRIRYTINSKSEYLDIELGTILNGIEWKAGQLRTYTIKLDEVNVKITDTVTPGTGATAENGYSGTYKDNVKIQNTGSTDAFIRAAIVGQWLDPDGNPVFGFTDKVNNLYIVESWYEDQFVNSEPGKHGLFEGLPGYKGAATFKADTGATAGADGITPGWQLCTDGYYYYTKIVEPGDWTGSNLFNKYTTLVAPKAELAGQVLESAQMYFVLEISTQAITAVKMDGHKGSRYTWKEAWANATGSEPVEK